MPLIDPANEIGIVTTFDAREKTAIAHPLTRHARIIQAATSCSRDVAGEDIKLSILMPVYNEEATITQAITEVLSQVYPCEIELIVVNDGSTDSTAHRLAQLENEKLIIREHNANKGKGAALLFAAAEATGTHVLPFDADLEYVADDIPKLLAPIIKGRCQVVYGTRLFGCNTVYQSYRYALGNRVLTHLANILFDAHISDLHTCLKLMPRSLLNQLYLSESGFGLDTEITARLLKQGIRPFEVPVSYFSRSRAEGKKITWRDAVACMRILMGIRVSRQSRPARHSAPRQSENQHSLTPNVPEVTELSSVSMSRDSEALWIRAANSSRQLPLAREASVGES